LAQKRQNGQSGGKRCGSDNTPWDNWRATHVEEQGGIEGLLAFYEPHFYLPFLITALALAFGLMGMVGLWKDITSAARLLAVAVTVCLCLVAAVAGHSARHEIREQELLNRVRRGYGTLLSDIRLRAIVVPAFFLLLVSLVTYNMITSDTVWKLARLFLLDPAYLEQVEREETISDTTPEDEQSDEADGLRKRIIQVLPFALMGIYITFMISITYSASLLLALSYAKKMNAALPQPIFLREDLLKDRAA